MELSFKKYVSVFFILNASSIIYSQTIKGKIVNNDGQPILNATLIVKDSTNQSNPNEFTIAKNGQYLITLKNKYSSITLEIAAFGYQKSSFKLEENDVNKTYIYDFTLVKEKTLDIQTVVVETKRKPFHIKKDTVTYNVSAYKDGSERKIQDIIKKLPGIEVNENSGEIKYKGRSIETVKLEGDDLFGTNYTLGTKNINVDMVEQVQAIENYTDNPLLKGIEGNDKVALNLKLKKGKTDLSGNIDIGNGIQDEKKGAFNNGMNLLAVSKKIKSFSTISHNNIGQNNTPYDYFSNNLNSEQIKENKLFAKKIIPENNFVSNLNEYRINANNQYFTNYNSIFKIGTKVSLKTNLFYINDKIKNTQNTLNLNYLENINTITVDYFETVKKPEVYRSDIEMKINTSEKSLMEYRLTYFKEQIFTPSKGVKNNTVNMDTELISDNDYLKNELLFTQKISDAKAFQSSIVYTTSYTPQEYTIKPSINNSFSSFDIQKSAFKKTNLHVFSSLLGNYNKSRYHIVIGGQFIKTPFSSLLSNTFANDIITLSKNEIEVNQSMYYISYLHIFLIKNLKITPSFKINYMNQNIKNYELENLIEKNNLTFEPNLTFKYKLNEISALITSINNSKNPISEEYLYSNQIQTTNRIKQNNIPTLEIQNSLNFSSLYMINNLYKQFQINLGFNYNQIKGNIFSKMNIDNNSTVITNFYLDEKTKNMNYNLLLEKYISPIESIVRFKTVYSFSKYKNIINNSDIRNNKTKFIDSEIFIKTAFDIFVNFENSFQLNQNQSFSNNELVTKNTQINNTFKIIIKRQKKWFTLLTSDFYIPNSSKMRENYLFLDSTFKYVTKSKIFEFNLSVKNILNKRFYTETLTTDYNYTTNQYNLLSRTILVNLIYNF